jgi:hypothetical protein
LTGIRFEFPDNSRVQYRSSRLLTASPPRVLTDTGRPPRVWSGSRPCMGRVMREIGVPSPAISPLILHRFRLHCCSPPPLLLSSSIAAPKLLPPSLLLLRSKVAARGARSRCSCSALKLLLCSSSKSLQSLLLPAGSIKLRSLCLP